jgi:hypothetical protein
VRRLANVAFKPRRVSALEPFVHELVIKFCEQLRARVCADLIRDLARERPALVIFKVLGIPDEDVSRVKAGAESRILFMFGHPSDEEQCRLARGMTAFWALRRGNRCGTAREPREDLTSGLLIARDGDLPA